MKTSISFKIILAILLIFNIDQINFSERNQIRMINFDRNAQIGTIIDIINDGVTVTIAGTSPSIAKASNGGFVVAYIDSGAIKAKAIAADGTLGSVKTLVAASSGLTYQNPSIAMMTDETYFLCYSQMKSTASGGFIISYYTTQCMSLKSTLEAGSISISNFFPSQIAVSYPAVYGLSDGKYGVAVSDGVKAMIAVGTDGNPVKFTLGLDLSISGFPFQLTEFTYSNTKKVAIVCPISSKLVELIIITFSNFVSSDPDYESNSKLIDLITATSTSVSQPSIMVLSDGSLYITYVETVSGTSNTIKYIICPSNVDAADDCVTKGSLTDPTVSGTKDCQYPHGTLLSNDQVLLIASCAKKFNGDFILYGILLDSEGKAISDAKWEIYQTSNKDYTSAQLILQSTYVEIVVSDGTGVFGAIYQEISSDDTSDKTSGHLLNQVVCLATLSVVLLFLFLL
eukprot:TRINITY_DN292_c0_g2_i1.p1 TRINITY_DN292_c0_g2~~TRINITY_DN292_c0_g2_i1.p1  ORF type:complete len:455 (+),score=76.29 TRINITY_DN292_c0_g2_i1:86-1450(+)